MSLSAKYHFMWVVVVGIVTSVLWGVHFSSSPAVFILMLVAWIGTAIYMPSTGSKLPVLRKFKIDVFWMLLALCVSYLFIAIPNPAPYQTVDRSTFFILMILAVCWKIWRGIREIKKSSS
jgi:hypothetical protein